MPTILTAAGCPAKYLSGMAMKSSRTNDQPSHNPINLSRSRVFESFIVPGGWV